MRTRILAGWNAQRWLRFLFAGVFLYAGIRCRLPAALVAAAFFGVQAVFAVGCCGMVGYAPQRNVAVKTDAPTDITFEEVTGR